MLWVLSRGNSNEYPQRMFYGELMKIILQLSWNTLFICSPVNALNTQTSYSYLQLTMIKFMAPYIASRIICLLPYYPACYKQCDT